MSLESSIKLIYWLVAAAITIKKLGLKVRPNLPDIIGRLAVRIWAQLRRILE